MKTETVYEQALRYTQAAYRAYRNSRRNVPTWASLPVEDQQGWFCATAKLERLILADAKPVRKRCACAKHCKTGPVLSGQWCPKCGAIRTKISGTSRWSRWRLRSLDGVE